MSDWQMTHNNDIAYASWDFNSLTILLFLKQLVQANTKENIKPAFCGGNPSAMKSPHTGPPKPHSSDSLRRESTGDQCIHRTLDQQYKKHKSRNSTIIIQVSVRITHQTNGPFYSWYADLLCHQYKTSFSPYPWLLVWPMLMAVQSE